MKGIIGSKSSVIISLPTLSRVLSRVLSFHIRVRGLGTALRDDPVSLARSLALRWNTKKCPGHKLKTFVSWLTRGPAALAHYSWCDRITSYMRRFSVI